MTSAAPDLAVWDIASVLIPTDCSDSSLSVADECNGLSPVNNYLGRRESYSQTGKNNGGKSAEECKSGISWRFDHKEVLTALN